MGMADTKESKSPYLSRNGFFARKHSESSMPTGRIQQSAQADDGLFGRSNRRRHAPRRPNLRGLGAEMANAAERHVALR
jgi:hypothetical protein